MLETALRVNGRIVLSAARLWNCSAPYTASAVITCGQVRCMPRGVAEPWKFTISFSSAVRARTASYHCRVGWVYSYAKSIFNPDTPQLLTKGSQFSRCAEVLRFAELNHRITWTLRALA